MTKGLRIGPPLFTLLAFALPLSPVKGQAVTPGPSMTPSEAEVWEMEETFWRWVRAGRVEDFRALWHEGFASWPCQTPDPDLPPGTPDWVTEIRDRNLTVTYELLPKRVRVFGEVAVTQYAARFIYDYGGGVTEFGDTFWKYTHTWKRTGEGWKIIGGMCGLLRTEGSGWPGSLGTSRSNSSPRPRDPGSPRWPSP